ncbi:MAG: hypothetical protein HC899_29095 [Leptolyngbyaceae cyanobacterium SM1_4_3]|nr:hypothetical protein [Leptolyngbyaceae cyanobacterium SM1_4_3]
MSISKPENSREAYEMIALGLKFLKKDSPESDELINWLYTPDSQILHYLNQLKTFLEIKKPTKEQRQKAGYLLEKILVLSFKGLAGYSEIKSYQSASHQYDLLVSGDNAEWEIVCDRLYLRDADKKQNYRGILIEAKAIGDSVSSPQFARLCSIMNLEFYSTVGLGIFFTIKGAAGFPKRGDNRVVCVKHARLCQVLFHARSGKKVVVLDKDDIFELDKNGALIKILIRKVKELEELSGLPTISVDEPVDVDLPDFLKDLM